ncbi:peptidylprolyl isomerase [Fortiea contorta]|uniref:peptidylprolyl isomerase n=1 Tax=Fortiea contorta TaxID=1892405 RepID=UPI00034698E7|nr:peptidylprolyl isomerase [Fortiea contorta]
MNDIAKIFIEPEEVINFLKSEMNLKEVYENILFKKIIRQVAQERGIILTTEEIEAEANRQRREQHLEKAADTLAWLADQLISAEDWEEGIRDRLLSKKLAEALFSQEVEKFFIQNRLAFEQVILYQLVVESEILAQELYYQIEEGEISFYDAAHRYDIDSDRRHKCGYEGTIYRFDLQSNIATIIFSVPPQQLIGPMKTEQGYHLFIVEELIPAILTRERYQEIINNMFKNWLVNELNYLLYLSLPNQF